MMFNKGEPKQKKSKAGKISIFTDKKDQVIVRFSATQNHQIPPESALQMASALIAAAEMAKKNIAWGEGDDANGPQAELDAFLITSKFYLERAAEVAAKNNLPISADLAELVAHFYNVSPPQIGSA